MKSLARATLVTATVVAVCFALLQVGGRVLFSNLERFEGTISGLFGPDVVVQGLEGRWRGLNPGVFAERIRFRGGTLEGFDFELDLIESLGRNRVVARRMTVADGRVAFERTGAGWRLEGASEGPAWDVLPFLVYSDEVWFSGRIDAREAGRTATVYVESWFINVAKGHRFSVNLQSEPNCADCALAVEGDITEDGPGAVKVSARSFSLGSELDAMLGLPGFEVALDGDWRRRADGNGRARLDISLTRIETPATNTTVDAKLGAWTEGGGYRGRFETLSATSGGHSLRLGGAGFFVPGNLGEPFADLWLPTFAAEEVAEFAVAALGMDHPVGRWLHNLAPRGRIDGFRARIDAQGVAYAGRGREAAITSYQGVPGATNVDFVASGHTRAVRLDIDAYDVGVTMPDFVEADETYVQGGGSVTLSFVAGNVGMRGERLWLDRGGARFVSDIALARPRGSDQVYLAVDAKVDRIAFGDAEGYIPLTIAPGLRDWLLANVRSGQLEDCRILFRGELGPDTGPPDRYFEMTAGLVDGVVDYHADWPTASRIRAHLAIAGRTTRLRGSARIFDVDVGDVDLRVPASGNQLSLRLRSRADAGELLHFVRSSPLRDAMPFLSETWTGAGPLVVAAEFDLPLAPTEEEAVGPQDLRVELDLEGVDVDLVDLGLRFDALDNLVRYEWPRSLSVDGLAGTLFGAPVRVGVDSDDETIRFTLDGSATVADAYRLLDLADPGIAEGRFDFDAVFEVFPGSEHPAELRIASDLIGVSAMLPEPLAKAADEAGEMSVSLQFLDDHVAISARYDDLSGWLHIDDDGIAAAALGLGVPVPMADASRGRVVVGGGLDAVDASAIAAAFGSATGERPAFAWELRDFRIGRIELDALELADLRIDGYAEGGEIRLTLDGRELRGTLERSGDAPWRLSLPELKLPAAPEDDGVALDPAVIDQLIDADVVLGRVLVGDTDYGSWRFGLRPVDEGIELHDVVAELRGLAIEATAPVLWGRDGTTRFEGTVVAGDLREVLPLWDFVPSVESKSFSAQGRVRWPGSPVEFDLTRLSGNASLDLTEGRFLDVEQGAGAARILSLINFSTIVKRMSLDFTDVFGRGLSFDRVLADLTVTDGLARLDGPAKITGTGLRFEIEGTVDFASGALDNTMVVTLPLHASLPWYAAFLLTSNPLAAAGVLFGQQVLKDPIKRLSSIDVIVGGTYDDPQVVTVGSAAARDTGDATAGGDSEVDSAGTADGDAASPVEQADGR